MGTGTGTGSELRDGCVNSTCTSTALCGNGVVDATERCDGTAGLPANSNVTCRTANQSNSCKFDFSQVTQPYCNGTCTWAGAQGCDQSVNLGPIWEYNVQVPVWYQATSILANHGAGTVITSVTCN